ERRDDDDEPNRDGTLRGGPEDVAGHNVRDRARRGEDRGIRVLLRHAGEGAEGGLERRGVHRREGDHAGGEEGRVRGPLDRDDEAAEPVADREQVEDRLAERGDEERRRVALPGLEVAPPDAEGTAGREHQSRRAWPVSVRNTSSSVARRRVTATPSRA